MRSPLRASRAAEELPKLTYSVAEVARMFGMSSMTLYRAISAGEFPALRIRGRLVVPAKALDEMFEAAASAQTMVDAADWVPGPRDGSLSGEAA